MIIDSIDWITFTAAAAIGILLSLTIAPFVGTSLAIAFIGGRIVNILKKKEHREE